MVVAITAAILATGAGARSSRADAPVETQPEAAESADDATSASGESARSPRADAPVEAQPEAAQSADDATSEARELFRRGRAQYDLGAYQEAIQSFRRAYELAPKPDLLLDIAQAYRMSGDCAKALIAYRSFLRLSPSPEKKTLARGHELALEATCDSNNGALSVGIAQARVPPPIPGADLSPRLHLAATGAVSAGGLILIAAGGIWLWNEGRFSSWQKEDAQLNASGAAALPPSELVRRQDANDSLLRSIRRTDDFSLGFAIGGAVLAATGAAVHIILVKRAARLGMTD